jgi:hypothetical protein
MLWADMAVLISQLISNSLLANKKDLKRFGNLSFAKKFIDIELFTKIQIRQHQKLLQMFAD